MKTDGYVKLDGDQLSADLTPNFETLKFLRMWDQAKDDNKKFDLDRDIAKKEEKLILRREYLQYGAKVHFDLAVIFATEIKVIHSTFFGFKFFEQEVSSVSEEKLIEALKLYNPDFWIEETCLLLVRKFNRNFEEFSKKYAERFAPTRNEFRIHRKQHYKSKYDYLYEQIVPFTELSGEVFVCIDDYNMIKRFIVDLETSWEWF